MNKRGQLITSEEARPAVTQHKAPCSDCPWARKSLAGWLGDTSREEWLGDAHGEARIECHTLVGAQCAGAAIYRANVFKLPRDPSLLRLPADRERVFSNKTEFWEHHDMKRVAGLRVYPESYSGTLCEGCSLDVDVCECGDEL
jgi:hypothetical protein